jgi:hypothetical protein
MKNKVAILAVLLGCQVVASSAALAYGANDRLTDVALQAPLPLMAQGDMNTADSPSAGLADGSGQSVESGVRRRHGPRRKHSANGHAKRRLSSGLRRRSKSAMGANTGAADGNCCASSSSGM